MNKNIIICIKNVQNEINEVLPGYIKLDTEYVEDNILCWNCCQECPNIKYLPLKYNNKVFYINGFFCSDACSVRYLYDTYKDKELWEKFQLLKFYHKTIYGTYIDIKLLPNRLLLKQFGGHIDIDNYRNDNDNCELVLPPVVIVNNLTENNRKYKKDKEYLKLYRKKTEKNTILNNL